jgi:hypothetical protein
MPKAPRKPRSAAYKERHRLGMASRRAARSADVKAADKEATRIRMQDLRSAAEAKRAAAAAAAAAAGKPEQNPHVRQPPRMSLTRD